MRQEFVVGGWAPGKGARSTTFGALLVGYYDDDGALRYAGRVGTGFTEDTLDDIQRALEPLARETSPFADPLESRAIEREVHFVEPRARRRGPLHRVDLGRPHPPPRVPRSPHRQAPPQRTSGARSP